MSVALVAFMPAVRGGRLPGCIMLPWLPAAELWWVNSGVAAPHPALQDEVDINDDEDNDDDDDDDDDDHERPVFMALIRGVSSVLVSDVCGLLQMELLGDLTVSSSVEVHEVAEFLKHDNSAVEQFMRRFRLV